MHPKRVISGLLPSFFVDAVRAQKARDLAELAAARAREKERQSQSWQSVVAHADHYENDLLCRFRALRSADFVPDGALLRANILSLAITWLEHADFSITDFGGATGDLGADVLAQYPSAKYTVVESPAMAETMRAFPKGGVNFTTDIPGECDIFFTSSTLQYLDEPMAVLATGLTSARHGAILVRNNFCETQKFDVQTSRLYHNGGGPIPEGFEDREISYPRRTLSEAEIIATARELGFQHKAALPEYSGFTPGAYGRQLVFWRS